MPKGANRPTDQRTDQQTRQKQYVPHYKNLLPLQDGIPMQIWPDIQDLGEDAGPPSPALKKGVTLHLHAPCYEARNSHSMCGFRRLTKHNWHERENNLFPHPPQQISELPIFNRNQAVFYLTMEQALEVYNANPDVVKARDQ
ncbi:hypothetical protein DPMN_172887 [Dreissena polymorpha]|uniref:Uncharacterized protein n=1 Tax=Dreissena polymorpha TaxID=45954 RepID=A0A9D4IGG3_DREPO|nr:hypothetical protein DPMN_172887 [Dreissena polymorpha]